LQGAQIGAGVEPPHFNHWSQKVMYLPALVRLLTSSLCAETTITLYRFNQGRGSHYSRELKSEQGTEPLTLTTVNK